MECGLNPDVQDELNGEQSTIHDAIVNLTIPQTSRLATA